MSTQGSSLQASDVSGQRVVRMHDVPLDSTVGELTRSLLAKMELPPNDAGGGPVNYQLRLDRDGRHLHGVKSEQNADRQRGRVRPHSQRRTRVL